MGDHRHDFDRFKPENFAKNLVIVDKLVALAEKKGVTPAQLSLAWLLAQWEGIIPIPGSVSFVPPKLYQVTDSFQRRDPLECSRVLPPRISRSLKSSSR